MYPIPGKLEKYRQSFLFFHYINQIDFFVTKKNSVSKLPIHTSWIQKENILKWHQFDGNFN